PWFAGDELTAADIQMIYPVEANAARGDGAARPKTSDRGTRSRGGARGGGAPSNTNAWLDRVRARPAYKKAIERGGPIMLE
ncbi:MAG: gstB 4, partial [Labilithrix sp.]|nr:gstB 4 [Labilithrix sp.]